MLAAADERWIEEHGLLADNPLLDQITNMSDLLRANPELGKVVRRGRSDIQPNPPAIRLASLLSPPP
jgi:hypothetical protein